MKKTTETLQAQTVRRKSAVDKNAQRDDIDKPMGEGGGDEEEDGESEDDNEDGLRIIFDEVPGKHSAVLCARENDGC